jgi:uracil-DNA glycosylase family protein
LVNGEERAPLPHAQRGRVRADQPGMTEEPGLGPDELAEAIRRARSLNGLRRAAVRCQACGLWERATQTVFGEGTEEARLVLLGEQPGDAEDRAGAPFVGPAGRILDKALDEAGIDRDEVYVTNVVKHFKWKRAPRGKRRIHQRPDRAEEEACRPWLEAELERIGPELIVCLGATAAQALFGRSFRVTRERGHFLPTDLGPPALATIHPSAVLRAPDDAARAEAYRGLVDDLAVAARQLEPVPG